MVFWQFDEARNTRSWHVIRTPARIMIGGASGTGKTHIIKEMLMNCMETFGICFDKIIYCISPQASNDPIYTELAEHFNKPDKPPVITFEMGLPFDFINNLQDRIVIGEHVLLVIDDLVTQAANSDAIRELFIVNSRKNNLTVILVSQNIYLDAKHMRTISGSSSAIVVTENKRYPGQIHSLARQLEPKLWRSLIKAYEMAIDLHPYSYLVIDLHPLTDPTTKYFSGFSHKRRYYIQVK
jgi:Poxvirus A32 protein